MSDAVAAALAEGYDGPPNGRVRDVPDQRTIRYYTTLGLLDRAAEMRGRTALYGRRHLLQLVAIKKLQAQGQTLAEVQRALTGQTDAGLARLAGLSRGEPETAAQTLRRTRPAANSGSRAGAGSACASEIDGSENARDRGDDARPATNDRPQTFQGVPLAEDVTLLLASSRPLDARHLEALRSAAAPLDRSY